MSGISGNIDQLLRRALCVGAVLVAFILGFAGNQAARATLTACSGGQQGQAAILGCDNQSVATTQITVGTDNFSGLWVNETGAGSYGIRGNGDLIGVRGEGYTGVYGGGTTGVWGNGTNVGVYGTGTYQGVSGLGPTGIYGSGQNFGVFGFSSSLGGTGVYGTAGGGEGLAGGGATGVHGTGTENGVLATGGTFGVFSEGTDYGVYATSSGGYGVFGANTSGTGVGVYASGAGMALQVNGKTEFSRSGRATIAGTSGSPKSSVTVTNVALTTKSLVLATLQRYQAGVYIEAAVPNVSGSSITIYLSKAVTKNFPVAWMVTEKP